VNAVTKAVTALDGVDGVNVDLEKKTVTVDHDNAKASVNSIREAIEEEGYDVV
jgi:copper chaperone